MILFKPVVEFHVPSVPVAQPRQRHRIVGTGKKAFVQNYTPKSDPVNAFKASVRHEAAAAYDGPPLQGPLRLDAVFVFPRPKNLIWVKKPMPRLFHAKKPDRDNLDKALMDSLKGLLWIDDAQVCGGELEKFIAAGDEQPHVEVVLSAYGESI